MEVKKISLWKYVNGCLDVFKWTGKNDYVALVSRSTCLMVAGTQNQIPCLFFDSHSSSFVEVVVMDLYLDDTLIHGSSASCPTFDNEPLCSDGPRRGETVTFECVGLEVWGVGV